MATAPPGEKVILLGDFNRHHPMWDEDQNTQLFTAANLDRAQPLLDILTTRDLDMSLPKDAPTLQSTSSKNYTRPDNVFLSRELSSRVVRCEVAPASRPSPLYRPLPNSHRAGSHPVPQPNSVKNQFQKGGLEILPRKAGCLHRLRLERTRENPG
ncbi:hypothetical protein BDV93DRAFT_461786 [Ceratobasidium sp. AG-I]|nr:hypothetical protein BDV93DRAFT_461786 [Ceratobasidium sp. AG-I]